METTKEFHAFRKDVLAGLNAGSAAKAERRRFRPIRILAKFTKVWREYFSRSQLRGGENHLKRWRNYF